MSCFLSFALVIVRIAVVMLKSASGHLFMAGGMSEARELVLRALKLTEEEVSRGYRGDA